MSDPTLVKLMARKMCRLNGVNPDEQVFYGPPTMGPKNTYVAPTCAPRPIWGLYFYECEALLKLVDEYRRDNPAE